MKIKMKVLPMHLSRKEQIMIVAPSRAITWTHKNHIMEAIKYLNTEGLEVNYAKNTFITKGYNALEGTPQQKADDINNSFDDKWVDAIWCAQGGTGADKVLDLIDYELIKEHPKIIMGGSDIEFILLSIYKETGMITFYAPAIKIAQKRPQLNFDYTKEWLIRRLFEKDNLFEPEENSEWKTLKEGKAKGEIIGFNLTILSKIIETNHCPTFKKKILFIEIYKQTKEEIISQLDVLKKHGVFKKINGIVIGKHYLVNYEGTPADEIILEYVKKRKIPVLKIYEFGHFCPHAIIPIGAQIELNSINKTLKITEEFLKDDPNYDYNED